MLIVTLQQELIKILIKISLKSKLIKLSNASRTRMLKQLVQLLKLRNINILYLLIILIYCSNRYSIVLKILKFAKEIYNINRAIECLEIVIYNCYINSNKSVNIILEYIRTNFIVATILE